MKLDRGVMILVVLLIVAGIAIDGTAIQRRKAAEDGFRQEVERAQREGERIREEVVLPREERFPAGGNLAGFLQKLGLSGEEVSGATAAAEQAFNLRQLRAGNTVTIGRSVEGKLREVDYKIDAEHVLKLVPKAEGFSAEVRNIPTEMHVEVVRGTLEDSLFNAVEDAGERPEIAMRMAQIFGYDLDFYTDPRKGDTFAMVVEKRNYATGGTAGYGRILAAEYVNNGKKYQAMLFHDPEGHPAYYTTDGKSLQKSFLRSPLKFAAPITSHFSKSRFHPILRIFRPHLGTDYAAPVGTPVQTIGSGKVVFAGRKGGEGNMVQIAHTNGYETMYLHLSRILVHNGEHVEIGKIIGLVGSTGLATGPHLDFRIMQKGKFLNFEKLGLPPSEPVAQKNWAEFAALRDQWLPVLDQKKPLETQANADAIAPPTAMPSGISK